MVKIVELAIIFCSDGFIIYNPNAKDKADRYKNNHTTDYMTLSWPRDTICEAIATMEKLFFQVL